MTSSFPIEYKKNENLSLLGRGALVSLFCWMDMEDSKALGQIVGEYDGRNLGS